MKSVTGIVSTVTGILALALAALAFLQQRTIDSKRLQVQLLSQSSLLNDSFSRSKGPFEVLYEGRKIPNFSILNLRIANVGGQPILADDFRTPLSLDLTGISEILSARQTGADPDSLQIDPTIDGESVTLSKELMNPGDWFSLEIGVVPEPGIAPMVFPTARIVGVKDVEVVATVPATGEGEDSWWLRGIRSGAIAASAAFLTSLIPFFWSKWPRSGGSGG
jgi:hypothetical protein